MIWRTSSRKIRSLSFRASGSKKKDGFASIKKKKTLLAGAELSGAASMVTTPPTSDTEESESEWFSGSGRNNLDDDVDASQELLSLSDLVRLTGNNEQHNYRKKARRCSSKSRRSSAATFFNSNSIVDPTPQIRKQVRFANCAVDAAVAARGDEQHQDEEQRAEGEASYTNVAAGAVDDTPKGIGKVLPTEVREVDPLEDDEHKAEIYSTKVDARQKKKEAREYAQGYVKVNKMSLYSIELLFDSPLKRRARPGAPADLSREEAIKILTESEARGMEIRMSALMWKHQKYAQSSTLQKYKSLTSNARSEDETWNLLRIRCIQLNSCAADMARNLAIGDELEARKIYAERESTNTNDVTCSLGDGSVSSIDMELDATEEAEFGLDEGDRVDGNQCI